MKKVIATKLAPSAIGPYSQGIEASGKMIFVSGQIPINPETGNIEAETIEGQTRQVLTNIKNILEASGADMSDVVKTTVLLSDIADFTAMNGVYAEFFEGDCPARAAFQVAAIPKGAKVEIEAIAVVG